MPKNSGFQAFQPTSSRTFILDLDLPCSQPLQGDLGDLPVHCDVGGELVNVDLVDVRSKDSGFIYYHIYTEFNIDRSF